MVYGFLPLARILIVLPSIMLGRGSPAPAAPFPKGSRF
jgi:hypothetical protein